MATKKKKKLKKLVHLQWKIVGMVVATGLLILSSIIIITSYRMWNREYENVDKRLHEANVDAMTSYTKASIADGDLLKSFDEQEKKFLHDYLDIDIERLYRPPNSDDKRSRPNIGGKEPHEEEFIPILTFQLIDDQLIETEYGIMSGYIDEAIRNEAFEIIKSSKDGIHNIDSLDVTFRKDTFMSKVFVAVTSEFYVYRWAETTSYLTLLSLMLLCIIGAISYAFARKFTTDLQTMWDNQERFIADASHDLKTPITIILTNSGILKRNKDKTIDDLYEWVDSIEEETKRMENLTNSMLDSAKVQNYNKKDLQKHFKQVNFSKVAKTVCLQLGTIAYENNINFNHEIDDGIFVLGLEDRLKKAVNTIVANSHKHSPKDDKILATLKATDKFALFSVNNEKSLISKDDMPYIFERFRHSSKEKKFTSHGLGLAISKDIIELHNGKIEVSSSVEEGTTFTIKLPLSNK